MSLSSCAGNLTGCHQCTNVLHERSFNGEVVISDCISIEASAEGMQSPITPFVFFSFVITENKRRRLQDLRLALGLAESVAQPTPIAAATNELYKIAKSQGLSDDDFSAVIEALKVKLEQRS